MFTPIINRIIYQPTVTAARPDFTPAEMSMAYEDIYLHANDGVRISGWYMKSLIPHGSVLYLHGNAGDRRDWAQVAPRFAEQGYNLFVLDYGAGHNDIDTFDSYFGWIKGFLHRPLHFVQALQATSDDSFESHL